MMGQIVKLSSRCAAAQNVCLLLGMGEKWIFVEARIELGKSLKLVTIVKIGTCLIYRQFF